MKIVQKMRETREKFRADPEKIVKEGPSQHHETSILIWKAQGEDKPTKFEAQIFICKIEGKKLGGIL